MKRLFSFSLFIIISYLLLKSNSCSTPNPNICIQVDPESCPGADLTTSVIHLKQNKYAIRYLNPITGQYQDWQDINYWKEEKLISNPTYPIGTANAQNSGFQNYIDGYEINYGWWSKDSFRKYSWAEMFKWKFKREPTLEELNNLTCEQVKTWFIERHTIKRSWPLSDDPPRNVKCTTAPITKYCLTLGSGGVLLNGKIEFPDGSVCTLEELDLEKSKFSGNNNPNEQLMRIKKPCAKCN